MRRPIYPFILFLFLLGPLLGVSTNPRSQAAPPSWEAKVDPRLLTGSQQEAIEFLVILRDQADLSAAAALDSRQAKGAFVFQSLSRLAERTQQPLRAMLDSLGVRYKPFWVVNMLWVQGDQGVLQQIALKGEVARIVANPPIPLDRLPSSKQANTPQAVEGIEWNISLIHAPEVWDLGYTGEGIVIGGQDTGYDWDHPALKNQYRGWDGLTADHNYNWHDTVTSGGGSCGPSSPEPCDDLNHGTHTMGIMVGDDGGANQIGVAPGAKWIGCRNMNLGVGTPASYIECYQWFIAPTDLNDENPDPSKAPHVINNSWGCPESEGCIEPSVLITAVRNVRAAGIVTVHSAGNSGPQCGSVNTPAAIYAESFTVGASDSGDVIASFSSRGPVTVDGSNRLKPNVSAPGVGVRSSIPGGGYTSYNGTSMAAPHVTGLVALLLSAHPEWSGDVEAIEGLIQRSAVPLYTTDGCGGDTLSSRPNHTYGWGRVDALRALQSAYQFFLPMLSRGD